MNDGAVEFDDTRSVGELIAHAFDVFGYHEPLGMEIVTVFQAHSTRTNTGWFTTDTRRSCAQEIENPDCLHFAYHMPGVFYVAEGGWGHHMKDLGNHPQIPDCVSLKLRFDEFEETVVINGNYRFRDIIETLKQAGYIDSHCPAVKIHAVYGDGKLRGKTGYTIPLTDPILEVCLKEFQPLLQAYHAEHLEDCHSINYEILELI